MTFIWWMYAADVTGSATFALSLGAIVSLIAYAIWALFRIREPDYVPPANSKLIACGLVFALTAIVLPSPRTMYAVAATTAGKDALHTPTGQKALKALNIWLDKQLDTE